MRMGWARLVALVLRAPSKSCAPIWFALLNCSAAHQSLSWIDPTWTCRLIGLENNPSPSRLGAAGERCSNALQIPGFDESRHIQIQRMAATMRASQLTFIGIVCVPTVTWRFLISRTRCPIAKIAKMKLTTYNTVYLKIIDR